MSRLLKEAGFFFALLPAVIQLTRPYSKPLSSFNFLLQFILPVVILRMLFHVFIH